MSRRYTKLDPMKPPPVKKLVRPMAKMSSRVKGSGGFRPVGK
jgi:hypothetical protein